MTPDELSERRVEQVISLLPREGEDLSSLVDAIDLNAIAATASNNYPIGSPPQWRAVEILLTQVRPFLAPIAQAVVNDSRTLWWWSDMDAQHQRWLSESNLTIRANQIEPSRVQPSDSYSLSSWWVEPMFAAVTKTSRGPIRGANVAAALFQGGHYVYEAASIDVWEVRPQASALVAEIHSASDWVSFVARFPSEPKSEPHWADITGLEDLWVIPDWNAVAAHYDGVHVSVGGYLSAAYRALRLPESGQLTMLAGWNSDETVWFHRVPTPIREVGPHRFA